MPGKAPKTSRKRAGRVPARRPPAGEKTAVEKTVVVFGAGATKACDGPLTNEILWLAYDPGTRAAMEQQNYIGVIERESYAPLLNEFLVELFNVPALPARRKRDSYPGLPLLLSIIDTAIDRKEPLGSKWVPERVAPGDPSGRRSLIDLRQALEYIIFAVLDYTLRGMGQDYYGDLLGKLYPPQGGQPLVISLNYDLIADNSLIKLSKWRHPDGLFPDYACEISTAAYNLPAEHHGRLLKIHGSLNWLYCPGCHRLDIGVSEHGRATVKVLNRLYRESKLEEKYSCMGSPCPDCGVFVRPVIITPTHRKDYRNPHIARIWHQAERMLREADHVIFVGYSLPDDDVEVVYLLKRGIREGCPVTVVEYDKRGRSLARHPVGARYRSLFGEVEWWNAGFAEYIKSLPS